MSDKELLDKLKYQKNLLLAELEDAANEIEAWGQYASEYFQDKHRLHEVVQHFRDLCADIKDDQ